MYEVSESYKTALARPARVRRIRGTIGGQAVTESNFQDGTLTITNSCSEGDEIKIGSVYWGELNATVTGIDFAGSWYGKVVSLREELRLADNTWEGVPLGVYRIVSANHTRDGVAIDAIDDMRRLDIKKWPYKDTYVGYPWEYLQIMVQVCHIELAQTEEEIRALPNGNRAFALYSEHDIDTCRDMLFWLAQTMACFATFNRLGKLELRQYGDPENPVDVVGTETRYRGTTSVSDFEAYYTAISFEDLQNDETLYYTIGMEEDDGLTYELGANPLLQLTTHDISGPFGPILDAIAAIRFTPFTFDRSGCPAYDLGDVIRIDDAGAMTNVFGCMMQFEYTFHGKYTMRGFGSNPALANVRTAADKEVAGAMARTKSNEIQYYTFTNAKDILLTEEDYKTVIDIRFGSMKDTLVVFQAELHMDVDTAGDKVTAYVQYIYDDEEMLYHPADTFVEGENLLHLLYYYRVSGGEVNRLKVNIKMDGGVATIEAGNIQACVWGQGLAASDKWDGYIECEDNITEIDFSTSVSAVDTVYEDADVELVPVITITANDTVEEVELATTPGAVDEILEELYINKDSVKKLTWGEVATRTWEVLKDNYGW